MIAKWYHYLMWRFWQLFHPCRVGWREYDHDWKYISDWYGDPDVIGGTADCSYWECQTCHEQNNEMGPPEPMDYDYF